jgi:hypothetical protein
MKISVEPEGALTIEGRVDRRLQTLLTLHVAKVTEREARTLEKICSFGAPTPSDFQLHTADADTLLEPYFCSGECDVSSEPRVLNGVTLVRIMSKRKPRELGEFGPNLYERIEKSLRAQGELVSPLQGGFPELEALFRRELAKELSVYLKLRGGRALSDLDRAFIRITMREGTTLH